MPPSSPPAPDPDPARVPAFRLDGVVVERDGRRILDDVDAAVPASGVTALRGPSGAGKTTLLRLLNRLDVPDRGTVSYRGTALDDLDPLVLRRRVGMVFQRPTPFPGTVRDNLAVAVPDADAASMTASLEQVSLDAETLDRRADTLSGGEVQRMCLARTLIVGPEALLLDEPTSSLDDVPAREFERTVTALAGEHGIAVVWVSHSDDQVQRVSDHVLEVREGRVTVR